MWKRISKIFGGSNKNFINDITKTGSSNSESSLNPNITSKINPSMPPTTKEYNDFLVGKGSDDQNEAHTTLRNAVRELSQGMSQPMTLSPAPLLNDWNKSDISDLPTEKLEELARAHYAGLGGFTKNPIRAVEIWTEAYERGDSVESSYSLASCLREGIGIEKNSKKAFEIIIDNAENKNYHLAHYAAANMLLNGEGTSIDHERSFKHFYLAAKGGVLPALHNLGNAYASGKGVKQSDHNAALYYSAGAEGGDTFSKFSLANWLYAGRGMKMDKVRAFQLQLEAATSGHPGAMFNVGSHYMTGEGINKADLTLAAEWFEKSANLGFMQARINLASMYRDGYGVKKDLYKAVEIFKVGSDKNNEICKQNMDEILLEIKYLESKSSNINIKK